MKRNLDFYVKKQQLIKTSSVIPLAARYFSKARENMTTVDLLTDAGGKARGSLNLPSDYDPSNWIVVCGYYAMYMAALSAIAKVGYHSKNHTATIVALEHFFVKKRALEPRYLKMLENAGLDLR